MKRFTIRSVCLTSLVIVLMIGSFNQSLAQGTQIGADQADTGTIYYSHVSIWGRASETEITPLNPSMKTIRQSGKNLEIAYKASTANYSIGHFIPVNTKMIKISKDGPAIEMKIVGADNPYTSLEYSHLKIENEQGYSGKKTKGLFEDYFGTEPIDLEQFPEIIRKEIQQGDIVEGMTRDQVIMARGYPPVHYTENLEDDLWTYFEGPEHTEEVFFANGKVD